MENSAKAILAYIYKDIREYDEYYLQECRELCAAAEIEVIGEISQQARSIHPDTGFRAGKVEELRSMIKALEADLVLFCSPVPPAVIHRLGELLDLRVMDRTSLILHIFETRARTKEAKLQVEIASLQHSLSTITETNETESHQRGGSVANRGSGEMRSTLVHRQVENRIRQLKKELSVVEKDHRRAQERRQKSVIRRVALVGYTNSGKSSLMNQMLKRNGLAKRQVEEKDMLFATLDTSVRRLRYQSREFLLYDTVGFISRLPHELIESFRTTLSAASEADLLLNVVDASDPAYRQKEEITLETLKHIQADHLPVLTVYNKIDLLDSTDGLFGLTISCLTGEGIDELMAQITKVLYPAEEEMTCFLPYAKIGMLNRSRSVLRVETLEENEDGVYVRICGPMDYLRPYRSYRRNKKEGIQ